MYRSSPPSQIIFKMSPKYSNWLLVRWYFRHRRTLYRWLLPSWVIAGRSHMHSADMINLSFSFLYSSAVLIISVVWRRPWFQCPTTVVPHGFLSGEALIPVSHWVSTLLPPNKQRYFDFFFFYLLFYNQLTLIVQKKFFNRTYVHNMLNDVINCISKLKWNHDLSLYLCN